MRSTPDWNRAGRSCARSPAPKAADSTIAPWALRTPAILRSIRGFIDDPREECSGCRSASRPGKIAPRCAAPPTVAQFLPACGCKAQGRAEGNAPPRALRDRHGGRVAATGNRRPRAEVLRLVGREPLVLREGARRPGEHRDHDCDPYLSPVYPPDHAGESRAERGLS